MFVAELIQGNAAKFAMTLLKSRLYELELRKCQAGKDKIEAGKSKIEWGSQIRVEVEEN